MSDKDPSNEKNNDAETVEFATKCFDRIDELEKEIQEKQNEIDACNMARQRLMLKAQGID